MDAQLLIYLATGLLVIFVIILVLSPWIKPDVWLTKNGLFYRKYLETKKVPLEEIIEIRMITKSGGSDFGNYFYPILKIILKDGSSFVETSGQGETIKFSWKSFFSNHDEMLLPSTETLKTVLDKNPDIKTDEFIKDYIKTGEVEKLMKVISG